MSKPLLTTYLKAMQMYDTCLPSGTITTVHALHEENQHANMLVADAPIVEKHVYVVETTRKQAIVSERYPFTGRTTEKEEGMYKIIAYIVIPTTRTYICGVRY